MAGRHVADRAGPDHADDREGTDCIVGQAWCPGPESEALPCVSCWLRRNRDDDPHPAVAAVADVQCRPDGERGAADDNGGPDS